MLNRVFKTGWTNFKRNPYLSVAATGIMTITLVLFLGLITFRYVSQELVSQVENKVDISAYFKLEAEEQEIQELERQLSELPEVEEVVYISREAALDSLRERHKDNELIQESLELFGGNPLRAHLNIKAVEVGQYATIATFIEGSESNELVSEIDLRENEDVIARIQRFGDAANLWGIVLMALIGIIAVLVAFNTIRLTIYSQRKEIEVMRLVGASNWQIRGPYLMEGAFYGVIAAVIALVVFAPASYVISVRWAFFMPGIDIFDYFISNWWQVILTSIVVGTLMGMASSFVAIRRYLEI